jgi:hypothetical protein
MAQDFRNQVDITPATNPSPGLHVHVPNGASASQSNNPTDFPAVVKGAVAVTVKIAQANGGPRFSNPS